MLDGPSVAAWWPEHARHRRGGDGFTRLSADRVELARGQGTWLITGLGREIRGAEGNPGIVSPGGDRAPSADTEPLATEPEVTEEQAQLARIADHQAIYDLMIRFGRGLDSKDWALYRSCFADRVIVDFAQSTGRAARSVPADGFVEFARLRQRGHSAFHQYSNFQVTITGDRARCILYMAARHRVADASR